MRVALVTLAAVAGLAAPAQASAHGRGPTVAIDYRLHVTAVPAGVHVRILDGDRALEARVDRGSTLLVTGLLREPMLRIDGGVWANRASPTAHADRVVTDAGAQTGWVRLSGARSYAWHDHRLTPAGARGRFAIGVQVNGRPSEIAGSALGLAAGTAALVTSIAFAVRDRPGGGVGWLQIAASAAVALALAGGAAAAALSLAPDFDG